MVDADYAHCAFVLVDPDNDPVLAPPGCAETL
jgi:hypothetical protein